MFKKSCPTDFLKAEEKSRKILKFIKDVIKKAALKTLEVTCNRSNIIVQTYLAMLLPLVIKKL